jgi:galactoside 2-L-fucosyltransferase 1/2
MRAFFSLDFSPLLISSTQFANFTRNSTAPVVKTIACRFLPELTRPNAIPTRSSIELTGYWQSYLHFAKYADELRERIFVGTPSIVGKVSQFFLQLYQKKLGYRPHLSSNSQSSLKSQLQQSPNVTWIGIHVRRGDFHGLHIVSSDTYLLNATQYFISLYPDAHFIVASDDKPYCARLFSTLSNVFLLPSSFSVGDDMIALAVCEHTIITGGTFGWWAAFLADGHVYHDTIYPSGCERREHYYPPWFLIDGHVRANKYSNYSL